MFVRAAFCAMVFVAGGSVWQAAAPAQAAAAQSDLSYSANATWTADPVDGRVNVFSVFSATSHAVDAPGRRYFYSSLVLTLPASSSGYVATSTDGTPLPVAIRATYPTGTVVEVGLGQKLYAGETAFFDLSFFLVDQGGSTDRDMRIGRNLMSFPVSAFGSPGTPGGSVTVVFPPGFSVQEEYGGLTRSTAGDGSVVYMSGKVDDAPAVEAWFTALEPVPLSDFSTRTLTVGTLHVTLTYWSDDPGWADQVERVLRAGYPLLGEMIGVGDPLGKSLSVQESTNQEIGGFSGSYEELSGRVQVSYYADPFVILHEVAHMWFNGTMATDRWIDEGFASYYAEQAVLRLGLPDHAPKLSAALMTAAAPLDGWVNAGQPDSAADAYLYAASLEAAREIAALAGGDNLSTVWSQIRTGSWAYQPLHGGLEIGRNAGVDSRGLLDYLEQATGRSFGSIWQQWIMSGPQAAILERRTGARTAYRDAIVAAGKWDLPPDIRRAMDTWQFDEALSFIGQARTTLATIAQVTTDAAEEGTTVPADTRISFEAGLLSGTAEANAELTALQTMTWARQAEADRHGAVRGLGLLGADPATDLTRARAAFATGDVPAAQAFASEAWSEWAGAAGAGEIRILGATLGGAGVLLLLAVLIWTRGGKRKAEPAAASATAAALASAAGAARENGLSGAVGAADDVSSGVARSALSAAGAAALSAAGASSAAGACSAAGASSAAGPASDPGSASPDSWICPAGDDAELPPLESVYELLQRGHALLRDQHNAQAAVVLERAARLEPGKASIVEALGRAYYNSGQHARAAEAFDALLEIDPSAHYGHFGLGLSLERLGQDREARTHLRLAAAMDPANPAYRRALDRIEAALV